MPDGPYKIAKRSRALRVTIPKDFLEEKAEDEDTDLEEFVQTHQMEASRGGFLVDIEEIREEENDPEMILDLLSTYGKKVDISYQIIQEEKDD